MKVRIALALLGVLVGGMPAWSQSKDRIKISMIPPSGPYETLGLVTAHYEVPVQGFWSKADPFKEVLKSVEPLLAMQAQARAADMVVISQISPVISTNAMYLLIFGTAVRSKTTVSTDIGSQSEGAPAQAAHETPTSGELSGTWTGAVKESGETEPVVVTVNLGPGDTPGELNGGLSMPSRSCEVSLSFLARDGEGVAFRAILVPGSKTGKCKSLVAHVALPTPDGKLQWKIFDNPSKPGWENGEPRFEGVLSRE